MRIQRHVPDEETTRLDSIDFAIMGCLLQDARQSAATIARSLGIAESTARNRLTRLVEKEIVRFALITDPRQFGFQVWAMLEIQVEPSQIRRVAETLGQEPEIHLVGIMAGSYDIYAGAVLRSNQELVDLITRRLSKVPGIIRISSSTMLEVVKRTVSFGFPAEALAMGPADAPAPAAGNARRTAAATPSRVARTGSRKR